MIYGNRAPFKYKFIYRVFDKINFSYNKQKYIRENKKWVKHFSMSEILFYIIIISLDIVRLYMYESAGFN